MGSKAFPLLEVTGTHREIGRTIGQSFREKISRRIQWQRQVFPRYQELLDQCAPYFNATKRAFPDLIKELEGIAEGSGFPLMELFLVNNRDLFDPSPQANRCTIAVSFNDQGLIVGHNEDWPSTVEDFLTDDLYILKATINKTTFLGLAYATEIPGDVANFNNWGLVQCINELMTKSRVGVPKNFIARAILECKTIDEAEKIITQTFWASGFNHVLAQNNEIRNFEFAGEALAIKAILKQPFVHTNHYLTSQMRKYEKFHTPSSEHRYTRASELVKNQMTREEMISLLSDTSDKEYPICRFDATVASLVFIPGKKEVWICNGHPCSNIFTKYNL